MAFVPLGGPGICGTCGEPMLPSARDEHRKKHQAEHAAIGVAIDTSGDFPVAVNDWHEEMELASKRLKQKLKRAGK